MSRKHSSHFAAVADFWQDQVVDSDCCLIRSSTMMPPSFNEEKPEPIEEPELRGKREEHFYGGIKGAVAAAGAGSMQ